MAGDWIPHENGLSKKPEVLAIAKATGKHRRWVAATLEEFWEWVDQVSSDGCLGVSLGDLPGLIIETDMVFWDAVVSVGWLRVATNGFNGVMSEGLTIPHFERWLGNSAKKRLSEARRKRLQREHGPPLEDVPDLSQKKRTKTGQETDTLSCPVLSSSLVSSSSSFEGGPGETFGPTPAARLGVLFADTFRGLGAEKNPFASTPAMQDLLDRGIAEAEIEAWIVDKSRVKTQKQWQFLQRWEEGNGPSSRNGNAQKSSGGKNRDGNESGGHRFNGREEVIQPRVHTPNS